MVSTTCVAGFPFAVLTVVKRPFPAFLPILLVLANFIAPLFRTVRNWPPGTEVLLRIRIGAWNYTGPVNRDPRARLSRSAIAHSKKPRKGGLKRLVLGQFGLVPEEALI